MLPLGVIKNNNSNNNNNNRGLRISVETIDDAEVSGDFFHLIQLFHQLRLSGSETTKHTFTHRFYF